MKLLSFDMKRLLMLKKKKTKKFYMKKICEKYFSLVIITKLCYINNKKIMLNVSNKHFRHALEVSSVPLLQNTQEMKFQCND